MIYIAGPFRGGDQWQVVENVRRAERVAVWCAQRGLHFICPHTMCSNFDKLSGVIDQFWIDMTLEMLRRSDLVLLVAGWRDSIGTKGEIKEARRLKKRVYEFAKVQRWEVFCRCTELS
jgi:hypothetical protein